MRFDLVFSYWIFIWYLLYMMSFVKYNPKFAILLGIIENIVLLILMATHGANKRTIFYFVFINTLIKVLPFYTLRHDVVKIKDVKAMLILFGIYIVWIVVNKQNLAGNYKMVYDSLTQNRDTMPFLALVKYVKRKTGLTFL